MTTPNPDAYRSPRGRVFTIDHLNNMGWHEGGEIVPNPNWTPLWFSTSPPVPEPTPEPQELGTVVRDAEGLLVIRWKGIHAEPWKDDVNGFHYRWSDLAQPVTVLHPGWSGETDD